ncbi:MAG: hypothetical protein JWM19_3727 [Actinomycetia bacterium]|nr:hypothetical protein [Actinomycetes bacterium]
MLPGRIGSPLAGRNGAGGAGAIWTVPLMVVSLVLALVVRGKPLSEEMLQVVEGKAGHQSTESLAFRYWG